MNSPSLSDWHLRRARGAGATSEEKRLTLIPAAAAPVPSLLVSSPNGWRLEFGRLPPVGWLAILGRARRTTLPWQDPERVWLAVEAG